MTCSWGTCSRRAYKRGLCNMHYVRQRRGKPMDAPHRDDREARFWARVDRRGPDECWQWTGFRNRRGYGHIGRGTTTLLAHRVAYELVVGPIPEGLTLDHLCCNTSCCNPAHLDPCTRSENVRRASERRTHCKRGHEFTPENTYVKKTGRACRQCALDYMRTYSGPKRAAA